MSEPEKPMTLKQAASHLQYSQQTVIKLAHDGVLPAVKLGKEWRFYPSDIKALAARRER